MLRRCAFLVLLVVPFIGGVDGKAGTPPPLSGWLSFGNGPARIGATNAALDPALTGAVVVPRLRRHGHDAAAGRPQRPSPRRDDRLRRNRRGATRRVRAERLRALAAKPRNRAEQLSATRRLRDHGNSGRRRGDPRDLRRRRVRPAPRARSRHRRRAARLAGADLRRPGERARLGRARGRPRFDLRRDGLVLRPADGGQADPRSSRRSAREQFPAGPEGARRRRQYLGLRRPGVQRPAGLDLRRHRQCVRRRDEHRGCIRRVRRLRRASRAADARPPGRRGRSSSERHRHRRRRLRRLPGHLHAGRLRRGGRRRQQERPPLPLARGVDRRRPVRRCLRAAIVGRSGPLLTQPAYDATTRALYIATFTALVRVSRHELRFGCSRAGRRPSRTRRFRARRQSPVRRSGSPCPAHPHGSAGTTHAPGASSTTVHSAACRSRRRACSEDDCTKARVTGLPSAARPLRAPERPPRCARTAASSIRVTAGRAARAASSRPPTAARRGAASIPPTLSACSGCRCSTA